MRFFAVIFLSGFLFTSIAQGRVFDINKETFAAYFLATGGGTQLGVGAVSGETSQNLQYGDGVKYNYSGEFGFMYSRPGGSLRFGLEILRPAKLETAATGGGQTLYSAESDIFGYAPKLAVEINVHGNRVSRSYFSMAVGLASMTMKNDYSLTAAGMGAFPGLADHSIEAKGSATLLTAGLGYEAIFTDTTTVAVEFGYRQLKFDNLTYTKDGTSFSGVHSSGDHLMTAAGGARVINLSGPYISIAFRFYL